MSDAFYLRELIQELATQCETPTGSTDGIPEADKKVLGVVESPTMSWKWTIYEAEMVEMDDVLMFGRVDGFESELGYFTLSQLEEPGAFCYLVENDPSVEFIPEGCES